jgi:hypothetical protein
VATISSLSAQKTVCLTRHSFVRQPPRRKGGLREAPFVAASSAPSPSCSLISSSHSYFPKYTRLQSSQPATTSRAAFKSSSPDDRFISRFSSPTPPRSHLAVPWHRQRSEQQVRKPWYGGRKLSARKVSSLVPPVAAPAPQAGPVPLKSRSARCTMRCTQSLITCHRGQRVGRIRSGSCTETCRREASRGGGPGTR